MDKLKILFYDDAAGRQMGLAILGASGLGKSHILKYFANDLRPPFRTRDRGTQVSPVVYVPLPPEVYRPRHGPDWNAAWASRADWARRTNALCTQPRRVSTIHARPGAVVIPNHISSY